MNIKNGTKIIHKDGKGVILSHSYLDYADLRNDKPLYKVKMLNGKIYYLYDEEFKKAVAE